jgi:hypothetical protein
MMKEAKLLTNVAKMLPYLVKNSLDVPEYNPSASFL